MNTTEIFEGIKGKKVLIIGDVMLDHYLSGKVERISPEAPVPVVRLKTSEYRLGGAANVALNVQAFGLTPIIFSVIGKDKNATVFRDLMQSRGMDSSYIFSDSSRPTTRKTRVLSGYQQLLRVDEEETHSISNDLSEEVIYALAELLDKNPPSVIIFQDYNKGVLSPALISQVIQLAQKHKIPTAVDPKFDHFYDFKNADLFKPNLKELVEGVGRKVSPDLDSLTEACAELHERLGAKQILITLSEHGVFGYENGQGWIIPVKSREIVDVCGAGDAVIASCSIGLAMGLDLKQTAQLANLAGGIVCESMGVVPVDLVKLKEELAEMYPTQH